MRRTDGEVLLLGTLPVVGVIWRVSLVIFEGSEDVATQIRLEFVPLLSTIGLVFVPALFGALLGNGSESATAE